MKDLKRNYKIPATPGEVFRALTNPLAIELWTGYPAEMSDEEGFEFSLWEGDITGRNLEILPGEKIVQQWYFGDQEEPSIVTILLEERNGSTWVSLEHTHIPDEIFTNISKGWNESYFAAVRDYFKSQ